MFLGTAFLQQLQRWVQSRTLDTLGVRVKELLEEDEPHRAPDYWDQVGGQMTLTRDHWKHPAVLLWQART